jgi:hypothetical protein
MAPEIFLPVQFFNSRLTLQPEKRLMLAVLENAIAELLKVRGRAVTSLPRRARDVEEWIASDAADWPFAFVNVCGALGIDADYLRAGVLLPLAAARRVKARDRGARRRVPFRREAAGL